MLGRMDVERKNQGRKKQKMSKKDKNLNYPQASAGGGGGSIEYWENRLPVGQSHSYDKQIKLQRSDFHLAVTMKSAVFWDVTPITGYKYIDVSKESAASIFKEISIVS
jgi:hypothetical protein